MKLRYVSLVAIMMSYYAYAVVEVRYHQRTYIVHMDKSYMPSSFDDHFQWYDSSIKSVSKSAAMLYTYNSVIHGFSTRLTAEEAKSLEGQPGILSVQEEAIYKLHSTHSPEFLGLGTTETLFSESNPGSDVIVEVLDTGVWPESKSLSDTGLGPIPTAWKGECELGTNFNSSCCNRKLIGARFFSKGYEAAYGPIDETMESKSPRDDDGHGTHTSTTAVGSAVARASLFGYAEGTARGMATHARLAVYKICWLGGCFGSDILAAMEKAVEDGVHILSLSIGGSLNAYYRDTVAIGAFNAMANGVFVSCSAGNDGALLPAKVDGKIVVCDRGLNPRVQKGVVVKKAGGVGMILTNTQSNGEELVADAHLIPTAAVGQIAGDAIKNYILSDSNPTATVASRGTQLGIQPSPVVAAFSSRGPNPLTPEILKPDFIAPGVNILAGWTSKVGPSGLEDDSRHVDFNIISGTSMSCPHVSGLAALIKAVHPEWSPAVVRSALMTTAYTSYKNGEALQDVATGMPSTPFDHGAGHVDPVSALDPGLVYDATLDDYLEFLCALKYTTSEIRIIVKRQFTCESGKKYSVGDLNYPSFAVPLMTASGERGGSRAPTIVKYRRILTNVGTPATYKVSVSSKTPAVKILVEPETLSFSKQYEKKNYTVTFTASSLPSGEVSFAHLAWSGGKYIISSPIAFSWT